MSERDTWQLLLDDFKKAREAPGSETLYALTDAWAAYIEQRETRVADLLAALEEADKELTEWGEHREPEPGGWEDALRIIRAAAAAQGEGT